MKYYKIQKYNIILTLYGYHEILIMNLNHALNI